MSRPTADTVQHYLKEYGWNFHTNSENCWITGWQSEKRGYPLVISLNDSWLSFGVTPLIKLGLNWVEWPEIMQFLLQLNHESRLVKIGIDEFGDVSLQLYLLNGKLSYSDFSDGIGVIGYYAERIYDELYAYLDSIGFSWHQSPNFSTTLS